MSKNSVDTLSNSERYSRKEIPIEDIIEYRQKGLSCNEIGKMLSCSGTNINNRLRASGYTDDRIKNYTKHKTTLLDLTESKLINHIMSSNLQKVSVRDSAVTFGVLFDKNRLEQGKSTGNLSIHSDIQAIIQAQASNETDNKPLITLDVTDIMV